MQSLPLPKKVIHKVESLCRTFLWAGGGSNSKKAPFVWHQVCVVKKNRGLNIISLYDWNKANKVKLPWNLSGKEDNMWIRWTHNYYIKYDNLMIVPIRQSCSWILKAILKQRDLVHLMNKWNDDRFKVKYSYQAKKQIKSTTQQSIPWSKLFFNNLARRIAIVSTWLTCHDILATRERFNRFGIINVNTCCFCPKIETRNCLMFECPKLMQIWKTVLDWLHIQHSPRNRNEEIIWVMNNFKGKGWGLQS